MKTYTPDFFLTLVALLSLITSSNISYGDEMPITSYCQDLGGKVLLLKNGPTNFNACQLGNEVIEAKTLYLCSSQLEITLAVEKYLDRLSNIELPYDEVSDHVTPISYNYCTEFDGETMTFFEKDSDRSYQFCQFRDQSAIELWTLEWGGSQDIVTPLTEHLWPCQHR